MFCSWCRVDILCQKQISNWVFRMALNILCGCRHRTDEDLTRKFDFIVGTSQISFLLYIKLEQWSWETVISPIIIFMNINQISYVSCKGIYIYLCICKTIQYTALDSISFCHNMWWIYYNTVMHHMSHLAIYI